MDKDMMRTFNDTDDTDDDERDGEDEFGDTLSAEPLEVLRCEGLDVKEEEEEELE